MLPSFCRESVVRVRPTMREERGSASFDFTDAQRVTVSGCSFQPSATSDDNARAFAVTDAATLYAPYNADFRNGDAVEVRGELWRVEGHPFKWAAFGPGSHQVIALKRQGA